MTGVVELWKYQQMLCSTQLRETNIPILLTPFFFQGRIYVYEIARSVYL